MVADFRDLPKRLRLLDHRTLDRVHDDQPWFNGAEGAAIAGVCGDRTRAITCGSLGGREPKKNFRPMIGANRGRRHRVGARVPIDGPSRSPHEFTDAAEHNLHTVDNEGAQPLTCCQSPWPTKAFWSCDRCHRQLRRAEASIGRAPARRRRARQRATRRLPLKHVTPHSVRRPASGLGNLKPGIEARPLLGAKSAKGYQT